MTRNNKQTTINPLTGSLAQLTRVMVVMMRCSNNRSLGSLLVSFIYTTAISASILDESDLSAEFFLIIRQFYRREEVDGSPAFFLLFDLISELLDLFLDLVAIF